MKISYDFEFPYAPCSIINVDAVDVLGTHKTSLDKETTKQRITNDTHKLIEVYKTVNLIIVIQQLECSTY